jgi:hypothetical protein
MNLIELKGSLVLITKSSMEFTYIRTNDTTLSLVELEAFRAMTLVLKPLDDRIFSRTSVAILGLVELVTPQYTVELEVFRTKSISN